MRRVLLVLGILVLPVLLEGQDLRRAGRFGGGFVRATRSQMSHASMIGRPAAEFRYPLDPRFLSGSLPSSAEWPGYGAEDPGASTALARGNGPVLPTDRTGSRLRLELNDRVAAVLKWGGFHSRRRVSLRVQLAIGGPGG
jgi:hypothetical protein